VGTDNRYHNLSNFWVLAGGETEIDWNDFANQLHLKHKGCQDSSQVLKISPWKQARPFRKLEEQQFPDAFLIDDQQRDLRVSTDLNHPVGIEHLLGKDMPKLSSLPRINQRIVDPNRKTNNGYYNTLEEALTKPSPGDVILIRHNGELHVPPLRLPDTSSIDLTIKPEEGYRPILVLGNTREDKPALFRLHDGKFVLEGLELRLQPQRPEFKSQTLVALLGEGQCTFRNCVITLDSQGHDTFLSVCTLHDQDGLMKMATTPAAPVQGAQLLLDTCLVRGDGDLAACKSNRSFKVELNNVLAALKGTLLALKPTAESSLVGQGQLTVHMERVTSHLGGYLLHWKLDKEARNVSLPQLTAEKCEFLPTVTNNALIRLELPESEIESAREKLRIVGANACGGYSRLFDYPLASQMTPDLLSSGQWQKFTEANNSRFFRGKLALADPPLVKMLPGQIKRDPELDTEEFGADLPALQKLLPAENEGK
jgi:hypothetical protein